MNVQGVFEELLEQSHSRVLAEIKTIVHEGMVSIRRDLMGRESHGSSTKRFLSVSRCAALADKSERTIRNWIDRGILNASRPHAGAAWVIAESDFNKCLEGGAKVDGVPSTPQLSNDERALLIVQRDRRAK